MAETEFYRIECNGAYKAGQVAALQAGMVQAALAEPDMHLVSEEGVRVPTHRGLLLLHSGFLGRLLSTLPCQAAPLVVSLPFNSSVLESLLAVLSCGVSLNLSRQDLLGVKIAADLLEVRLGKLEVENYTRPVSGPLFQAKKRARKQKEISPQPCEQNDDYGDADSDEIEVTPEMYGNEEGLGSYAPHFLMEAQYGEQAEYGEQEVEVDPPQLQSMADQPQLLEVEGEPGEEKKYKCSFCPNKIFKKKPEVLRHFKIHIPLSQRKRFQCERCKERFISNCNLKTHSKLCTGVIKIHTCKRCKAEFDNKTDYEAHLAEVHNTGRNHKCEICHKQMRRAGDVRKHMLTHSESKQFPCDICGKKFRTESYVKVHKQAHYNNGQSPTKKPKLETESAGEITDEVVQASNGNSSPEEFADSNGVYEDVKHDGATEIIGNVKYEENTAGADTNGYEILPGHKEDSDNGLEEEAGSEPLSEGEMLSHKYTAMTQDTFVSQPPVERFI